MGVSYVALMGMKEMNMMSDKKYRVVLTFDDKETATKFIESWNKVRQYHFGVADE